MQWLILSKLTKSILSAWELILTDRKLILVDWHFKLIEGFYWKNSAWDGNFQIKFFSGIFKMEHLSNRNLIGTFQKLNDRKYHFLRKMTNYTFLEGQERFWVSKNQKLSLKPQPEMVYSNIFFSQNFIPKDFEKS